MRAWVVVVSLLAGCGSASPPPLAGAREVVARPPVLPRRYAVTPGELGDDGVVERMRHRVRLRHYGEAWLRLGGEPLGGARGGVPGDGLDRIVPVLAETARLIRVVVEEDDARLAMWVDRVDAWPTVIAPAALVIEGADQAAAPAGVWLEPGAPIDVGERRGGRRAIAVRDPAVEITGSLPASHLGHVWHVERDERRPTELRLDCDAATASSEGPRDSLPAGTPIRSAPDSAQVLATVRDRAAVRVITARQAATEVELVLPYVRVRGFVDASAIESSDDEELGLGCIGTGRGFSHSNRIEVAPGTCLYDRAGGQVVGVQLAAATRYGARARDAAGWSLVLVRTPWAMASLAVRHVDGDLLDSCAPSRRRR